MRFVCPGCAATFQTATPEGAPPAIACPACGIVMGAQPEPDVAVLELRPDRLPTRRYDLDELRARLELEREVSSLPRPAPRSGEQVWFAGLRGRQVGPLTHAGLQGLHARGQLTAASLVWRDGFPAWVCAEAVPELRGLLGLREEKLQGPFAPRPLAPAPAAPAPPAPALVAATQAARAPPPPARAAEPSPLPPAPSRPPTPPALALDDDELPLPSLAEPALAGAPPPSPLTPPPSPFAPPLPPFAPLPPIAPLPPPLPASLPFEPPDTVDFAPEPEALPEPPLSASPDFAETGAPPIDALPPPPRKPRRARPHAGQQQWFEGKGEAPEGRGRTVSLALALLLALLGLGLLLRASPRPSAQAPLHELNSR